MHVIRRTRVVLCLLTCLAPLLLWRCGINLWCMLTDYPAYVVPTRSSIFTFTATQMNEGSGGWWIYGRDLSTYYWYADGAPGRFSYISGAEASRCPKFKPTELSTWCAVHDGE